MLSSVRNAEQITIDMSGIKKLKVVTTSAEESTQISLADAKLYLKENSTEAMMEIGEVIRIQENMSLAGEAERWTSWISADENVAVVDANGNITAVAAGTTTITAAGTNKTLTATITVTEPEIHTHNMRKTAAKAATCTTKGNIKYYQCTDCKKYFSNSKGTKEISLSETIIALKPHFYTTIVEPATPKKEGKKVEECAVCGDINKVTSIAGPKTVKLSKTTYTYNGKALKPKVTVSDSKGKKIASSNYTITYSKNKEIGTAKVTIRLKGNYKGTITKTFTINPKKISISKVTANSKGFIAKWKKASQITGYGIQYSTSKKFIKSKSITLSKNTVSYKASKLTGKKNYYVRIRTYKTVSGKKYYSEWSAAEKVKTQK